MMMDDLQAPGEEHGLPVLGVEDSHLVQTEAPRGVLQGQVGDLLAHSLSGAWADSLHPGLRSCSDPGVLLCIHILGH